MIATLQPQTRAFAPAHAVKQPLSDDGRARERRRCSALLASAGLGALSTTLSPLRASAASQVYRAGELIVKVHADPAAFARELAASRALAGTPYVPVVHRIVPASRMFVLEDVGTTPLHDVRALAVALGRIHAIASAKTAGCSLGSLVRHPPPPWVVDAEAYRDALALAICRRGSMHVPVAIGDLKPEHVLRRVDGSVVLIDFETFTPGRFEEIDLLSLANFGPVDWHDVLAYYGGDYEQLCLVARAAGTNL